MNTDNLSKIRTVIGEVANEQREKGNSKTANLIASAPDMLKALNGILGYFSEYEEDYSEKLECFENARKVIDRAEGK